MDLENLQSDLPDWLPIDMEAVGWFAVVAVLSWVLTLLTLPVMVAWIPVDYFSAARRHPLYSGTRHPLIGLLLAALKNVVGLLLILLGIVMLFTPGQGILTILIGLLLANFPGKYKLERWMVTRPGVLRTLNGFRLKVGRQPLEPPA